MSDQPPTDPEEELMAWQDVLDSVMAGRPGDLTCPFCRNKPLVVEEDQTTNSTKIACNKCKKFIQGRFA